MLGKRVLRIRHITQAQSFGDCQILFVGSDGYHSISAVVQALKNAPILTVGEEDDFLPAGGMIRFRLQENKVRFEINRPAADAARLKISSRLQYLANNWTEK